MPSMTPVRRMFLDALVRLKIISTSVPKSSVPKNSDISARCCRAIRFNGRRYRRVASAEDRSLETSPSGDTRNKKEYSDVGERIEFWR